MPNPFQNQIMQNLKPQDWGSYQRIYNVKHIRRQEHKKTELHYKLAVAVNQNKNDHTTEFEFVCYPPHINGKPVENPAEKLVLAFDKLIYPVKYKRPHDQSWAQPAYPETIKKRLQLKAPQITRLYAGHPMVNQIKTQFEAGISSVNSLATVLAKKTVFELMQLPTNQKSDTLQLPYYIDALGKHKTLKGIADTQFLNKEEIKIKAELQIDFTDKELQQLLKQNLEEVLIQDHHLEIKYNTKAGYIQQLTASFDIKRNDITIQQNQFVINYKTKTAFSSSADSIYKLNEPE